MSCHAFAPSSPYRVPRPAPYACQRLTGCDAASKSDATRCSQDNGKRGLLLARISGNAPRMPERSLRRVCHESGLFPTGHIVAAPAEGATDAVSYRDP
jgi:hypothetical protein